MESFLKQVAADLYSRKDGQLARTALVFPNKRAGLFFNEYLAQQSDKPLWSPSTISISELFRSLSKRETGDPVKLICELYKVFQKATQSNETLDDFYFWGELLLSDFDDADKNLVDTEKLFTNLQDLRALMDDYTFMDQEQEAAIQQFFRNFSIEKHTALKEKFISIWDVLGTIYNRFRKELEAQGIAYIPPYELERREQEELRRIAEENRISELKEYCAKKGLDFDTENAKYLAKQAKKKK